ncbi:MAG TPA: PTS sugar transporter subunit IIA [Coprothermobacter proteolyticus]|nr:PTS sugar transporter subunit IIA [Coprothermobacter proteolyticus]
MKVSISEVLRPELMKFGMEATDKKQAILELAELMWEHGFIEDLQGLVDATMEREAEYSTGIGMGVGIPHAKSAVVKQPVVAFGKSNKGIEFDSFDGEPVYLVFLIAVPEKSDKEHLNILSTLSRALMHEEVRDALMRATTPEEVISAFQGKED